MAKSLSTAQKKTLMAIHLSSKDGKPSDFYGIRRNGGSIQSTASLESMGLITIDRKDFVYYTLTDLGRSQLDVCHG